MTSETIGSNPVNSLVKKACDSFGLEAMSFRSSRGAHATPTEKMVIPAMEIFLNELKPVPAYIKKDVYICYFCISTESQRKLLCNILRIKSSVLNFRFLQSWYPKQLSCLVKTSNSTLTETQKLYIHCQNAPSKVVILNLTQYSMTKMLQQTYMMKLSPFEISRKSSCLSLQLNIVIQSYRRLHCRECGIGPIRIII